MAQILNRNLKSAFFPVWIGFRHKELSFLAQDRYVMLWY